jgi:hypothetical protein
MKFSKNKANINQIQVATFNTRTLSNDAYLSEFENALKKVKYDVIGLSETKRNGEGSIDCADFRFYYNGKTKKSKSPDDEKAASSGFIVNKRWLNNIKMCKCVSFRVLVLILKINKTSTMGFVQVYAPTSKASENEMNKFYGDVEKAQKMISDCTWKIVMGDWNSKIGLSQDIECDVMGQYGYGKRNERGERLIRFCRKSQLVITNTMFKKKPQQKWTWSLDMKTKNEIDFILTPHKNCVKNVEVLNSLDFESDHRMVRMTFELNESIQRLKQKHLQNFFVNPTEVGKIMNFNNELKNYALENENEVDVEEKLKNLKLKVMTAGEIFQTKPNQRPVITPVTKELIRQREFLRREARRNPDMKLNYYAFRKDVKKKIRNDVRNFELLKIDEAIRNNKSLKTARDGINKERSTVHSLKDEKGVLQSESSKINEIASNFYEKLFSSTMTDDKKKEVEPDLAGNDVEEFQPIDVDEIKIALTSMKLNKARGPDEFPVDLLKVCDDFVLNKLAGIFNEFLKIEKLPSDWLETNIVLIFKKGKKDEIKNYRPIS